MKKSSWTKRKVLQNRITCERCRICVRLPCCWSQLKTWTGQSLFEMWSPAIILFWRAYLTLSLSLLVEAHAGSWERHIQNQWFLLLRIEGLPLPWDNWLSKENHPNYTLKIFCVGHVHAGPWVRKEGCVTQPNFTLQPSQSIADIQAPT